MNKTTIVINNSLDCIGFRIGLESFDISSLFGISFCDAKSMYDGGKRGLLSKRYLTLVAPVPN